MKHFLNFSESDNISSLSVIIFISEEIIFKNFSKNSFSILSFLFAFSSSNSILAISFLGLNAIPWFSLYDWKMILPSKGLFIVDIFIRSSKLNLKSQDSTLSCLISLSVLVLFFWETFSDFFISSIKIFINFSWSSEYMAGSKAFLFDIPVKVIIIFLFI